MVGKVYKVFFSVLVACVCFAAYAADAATVKMSFTGPADAKTNALYYFVERFTKYAEEGTEGRVKFELYPDGQLGSEQERMELLMKSGLNQPVADIASFAGLAPVVPELYASSVPFMFNSYEAAHLFFDGSEYWTKLQGLFEERAGGVLLDAVEEGGFLAFTNSQRELKSPSDFKGLKFRGMDEGQLAIFQAFGASGTPIPWGELYLALKSGVVEGQMNPAMYIIIGSLYEVQKYMTLANIQYSDQFLVFNGDLFKSFSPEDQQAIRAAARKANNETRAWIEVEDLNQIEHLKQQGMQVYAPTAAEMDQFRSLGQPGYIEWLKSRVPQEWIDLALKESEAANEKTASK
ncbi:MAG: TRAP transporter substrate-binding protein DctP [Synergistaceae bacterium]|jgi:tripartite ATP-independent transporter DctP family solute receptor|nr:TRAP transporter substrate-binding protein DctP [Synergistaceae bacterium]